jgi:hypothetical protein
MKTTARIALMIFIFGTGLWLKPQNLQAQPSFTFQVFYDELSPYGTWIDSPEYGYVWVPDAGPGFFPYSTGGYWVYSNYGWTWVSDYSWGWAPFHYGRWYYDNWYGWVWVPGNEWGPGWVSWRKCDGFFGWAPLVPGFQVGIVLSRDLYRIPHNHWCFVPDRYFGGRDMRHHYVGRRESENLFNRSSIIVHSNEDRHSHTRYYSGPEIGTVKKATGRDFKAVEIKENNRPGQTFKEGKLEIYRPEVRQVEGTVTKKPAPAKVTPYSERSRNSEPAIKQETKPAERKIREGSESNPNEKSNRDQVHPSGNKTREQARPAEQKKKESQGRVVGKPGSERQAQPVEKGKSTRQNAEPPKKNSNDGPPKKQAVQSSGKVQGHQNVNTHQSEKKNEGGRRR